MHINSRYLYTDDETALAMLRKVYGGASFFFFSSVSVKLFLEKRGASLSNLRNMATEINCNSNVNRSQNFACRPSSELREC